MHRSPNPIFTDRVTNTGEAFKKDTGNFTHKAHAIFRQGKYMLDALDVNSATHNKDIDRIVIGTMVAAMIVTDDEYGPKEQDNAALQWRYPMQAKGLFLDTVMGDITYYMDVSKTAIHPLKDNLSHCTQVMLLREDQYDRNMVFPTPFPAHTICMKKLAIGYIIPAVLSLNGDLLMLSTHTRKISDLMMKHQISFDKENTKTLTFEQNACFVNELITLCQYDNPLFYSYIPVIGRQIMDEKTLPFYPEKAKALFRNIMEVFPENHFAQYANDIQVVGQTPPKPVEPTILEHNFQVVGGGAKKS